MRLQLLTLFLCTSFFANAQDVYSYISERTFKESTDLLGYNFRPHKMEVPGDYSPTMIEEGSVAFGITRSRLYVNGDKDVAGLYEVSSIVPTNYGYKLALLNPRNPSNQGHLKVIINKLQEAEAVVFKKESKANEIIFHLPDAPRSLLDQEQNFYTDLGEIMVEDTDSLWGKKLIPYMRVNRGNSIQGRTYEADSTYITFEEVISIKEKKKKKKRSKKKKSKKKDKSEEEMESWEELNEEQTEEATAKAAPVVEDNVKRKVTKSYFVKINTIMKNKDGGVEKKSWSYPVKEIDEREDESAGAKEERFQLAIRTKGKKEIYLYLNGDRTVSSFEADGVLYLMRGH